MRLYRLIFTGMLITFMAVGYVHQRIEIVKTAYKLQENQNYLSGLIDQNSNLSYNLSKLESPSNLLASLNRDEIEFAGHRNISHNKYLLSRADTHTVDREDGFIEKVFDVFTVKAEAQPRG